MTFTEYSTSANVEIDSGCPGGGAMTVRGLNAGCAQCWGKCSCCSITLMTTVLVPFRIAFGLLFGVLGFAADVIVTLFWALTGGFCGKCRPRCPWVRSCRGTWVLH